MPDDSQEKLQKSIQIGHEQEDIGARSILAYGLILMISVPVVVLLLWGYFMMMAGTNFSGFHRPTLMTASSQPVRTYPKPHLILIPGEQLRETRALEDVQLSTYGWIDPTQRVVRIPIAKAMELTAQRGLPVRHAGITNLDGSEYELVIKRRLERERLIREGKVPEE